MPLENLDLSNVNGSVVIIPAAGRGTRFDQSLSKQYQLINGVPLLEHTLALFVQNKKIDKIVLVTSSKDRRYQNLPSISDKNIIVVDGGEERQDSVNNALKFLYDNHLPDDTPVLVHDAVRPCLSPVDIDALIGAYGQNKGAYFLAENVCNSLKKLDQNLMVEAAVEREDVVSALTPQMAPFLILKHAYAATLIAGLKITDEVGALANNDVEVKAIFATDLNPKVTFPRDLELAKSIIDSRKKQLTNKRHR